MEKKKHITLPFCTKNGIRQLTKRKLWDRYCNKRRSLKELGLLEEDCSQGSF